MSSPLTFKDLWIGDRFKLKDDSIWTKLSSTTARKHSEREIELKEKGYGYLGSSICSFEPQDAVSFLPVQV